MPSDVYSITLAAGAGSRMPEDMPPKPCCKVGPAPVIGHALSAYEQAGITDHVVVVGCNAEQVMDEVAATGTSALYAYQETPLGTGHAARRALEVLQKTGAPEHVLICAGDKLVDPGVFRALVEHYGASELDLCLTAGRADDYPTSGRILTRDGLVQAIIEVPDIRVRRLARTLRSLPPDEFPQTAGDLKDRVDAEVPSAKKLDTSVPELGRLLEQDSESPVRRQQVLQAIEGVEEDFSLPTGRISLDDAEAADRVNLSIYLGRFDTLWDAIRRLDTDNAQRESYITDVAHLLAADGKKVGLIEIDDPRQVMGFNTMEELRELRTVHAQRAAERATYPALERWNNLFEDGMAGCAVSTLIRHTDRRRPAVVVRSPGRVNLMGRHVDHQGGTCNLMAIDRELVLVAAPRRDDLVNLWNHQRDRYPHRSFTLGELTRSVVWDDWLQTLDSQFIQRMVSDSSGDWVNYVKGAALRLQHRFPDRQLRGMDAAVCGNVPAGAGLSSSSALVVAAAEALCELNGLNVRPREFVDLCGEGEWFVGTRGGCADHAAIKFGQRGHVIRVSFFPFQVTGTHPFPEGCSLIVAHSGQSAEKTRNARQRFNSRVACYHMARESLKKAVPAFAPRIQHLRDINTDNLDVSLPGLYRLLKNLPLDLPAEQARALARAHPTVDKCLDSETLSGDVTFPLRDVALYGLAECERSARVGDLLDAGEATTLGELMRISHDGDRICRWSPEREEFDARATDGRIDDLIRRAGLSEAPLQEEQAALWQQPGAYGCSTPEIDLMVDTALGCEGVLGAQLAGAGLGGCIMILVQEDAVDEVRDALRQNYYTPHQIEPKTFVCNPSIGSRVYRDLQEATPQ